MVLKLNFFSLKRSGFYIKSSHFTKKLNFNIKKNFENRFRNFFSVVKLLYHIIIFSLLRKNIIYVIKNHLTYKINNFFSRNLQTFLLERF